MIDLTNTTFIIPVMLESFDRYRNITMLLYYLNNHFKTNIIIYEVLSGETKLDKLIPLLKNLDIKLLFEKNNNTFHRTKYLNIMLDMVKTPVVVNYDTDILLPVESYINAQNMILNNEVDIIYPFDVIKESKFRVNILDLKNHNNFLKDPNLNNLEYNSVKHFFSTRGFCIFFNTEVYKNGGGENENFISWGPEDEERYIRFNTLGYNITNFENSYLYHLEHIRTKDSSKKNPFFDKNSDIFNEIKTYDKEKMLEYIKNQEYLKNYDFIKK